MPRRADTVSQVAALVRSRAAGHPLRVGIDGLDAAGKTRFVADLRSYIDACRPLAHADVIVINNEPPFL